MPRSPVAIAVKNVLTLGFYTKLWLYRVNREMDGHEGFHIDLRWLGAMVALPFVTPAVVKFQTARRLNQMVSHQVTQPLIRARALGWISLVPVLGAGFYAWWVQTTLNRHWFHHRREERIRLASDRLELLRADDSPEAEAKRVELRDTIVQLQREIDEEIEAARLRWGEERFSERKKRADLHAMQGGRMSRKDLQVLREEAAAERKAEKARRRAERAPLFGLLPKRAADRDPDDDAAWQSRTQPPERTPEQILAVAAQEGRDLTKDEEKERAAAEKVLARIEKERTRLEKQRAAAREQAEKTQAAAERRAERERLRTQKAEAKAQAKAETTAAKAAKKQPKAKKTPGAKSKAKAKGKAKAPAPDKIAVQPRRVRAPDVVVEVGEGPLRLLTIQCPRCRTQIEGIRKRGDAPAKVTCPGCGLVGKA